MCQKGFFLLASIDLYKKTVRRQHMVTKSMWQHVTCSISTSPRWPDCRFELDIFDLCQLNALSTIPHLHSYSLYTFVENYSWCSSVTCKQMQVRQSWPYFLAIKLFTICNCFGFLLTWLEPQPCPLLNDFNLFMSLFGYDNQFCFFLIQIICDSCQRLHVG